MAEVSFVADTKLWSFTKPAPLETRTTLTLPATPSAVGQSIGLTAAVEVTSGTGPPTGSVEFRDGNKVLATVAPGPTGTASLTTATLGPGRHAITAVYAGDDGCLPSTSATIDQVILPATTVKLIALTPTAVFGQTVALTATVTPTAGGSAS